MRLTVCEVVCQSSKPLQEQPAIDDDREAALTSCFTRKVQLSPVLEAAALVRTSLRSSWGAVVAGVVACSDVVRLACADVEGVCQVQVRLASVCRHGWRLRRRLLATPHALCCFARRVALVPLLLALHAGAQWGCLLALGRGVLMKAAMAETRCCRCRWRASERLAPRAGRA